MRRMGACFMIQGRGLTVSMQSFYLMNRADVKGRDIAVRGNCPHPAYPLVFRFRILIPESLASFSADCRLTSRASPSASSAKTFARLFLAWLIRRRQVRLDTPNIPASSSTLM